MGREWQIGDPVDYTTDGWMDAQNWGHGEEDEEIRNDFNEEFFSKSDEYAKMAWDYHINGNEMKAFFYINNALDVNDRKSNYWNIRAIILESMEMFDESERNFERSLEISKSNVVYDNLARMLLNWTFKLMEDGKNSKNGMNNFKKAEEKITHAIKIVSRDMSEENPERFLRQKDTINYHINYEARFRKNLETLKSYSKDELFTITGRMHYNNIKIDPGTKLRLIKEPDNEFDRDAIAVYAGDAKIGYVANNDYTKYEMTSTASELKDKIPDEAQGEYLIHLDRYFEIHFDIGRIVKK